MRLHLRALVVGKRSSDRAGWVPVFVCAKKVLSWSSTTAFSSALGNERFSTTASGRLGAGASVAQHWWPASQADERLGVVVLCGEQQPAEAGAALKTAIPEAEQLQDGAP